MKKIWLPLGMITLILGCAYKGEMGKRKVSTYPIMRSMKPMVPGDTLFVAIIEVKGAPNYYDTLYITVPKGGPGTYYSEQTVLVDTVVIFDTLRIADTVYIAKGRVQPIKRKLIGTKWKSRFIGKGRKTKEVFKVQLGAFLYQKNAEHFLKIHTINKYGSLVRIEKIGNYWKTRLGKYSSYNKALRTRANLRKEGYKDAWVVKTIEGRLNPPQADSLQP